MLSLVLLRHAKSSWGDPDLDDHARALTERGCKAATRIGRYIREKGLVPDRILCSDAIRTRATLALVLEALPAPSPPAIITDALYLAEADQILALVGEHAGDARRVLVIGHNPGLHALALWLSASGKRSDVAALAMRFPTAALAEITFDVDAWADVRPEAGKLARFVMPRNLAKN